MKSRRRVNSTVRLLTRFGNVDGESEMKKISQIFGQLCCYWCHFLRPMPGPKVNPRRLLFLRPASWLMSAGGACISIAQAKPALQMMSAGWERRSLTYNSLDASGGGAPPHFLWAAGGGFFGAGPPNPTLGRKPRSR